MGLEFNEKQDFGEIIGLDKAKELVNTALISKRNILLVGPPGTGKTTLAKNIADLLPQIKVYNCAYHCSAGNPSCPDIKNHTEDKIMTVDGQSKFIRIQGSPDLVVEDLIGDIDPKMALEVGPSSIEAFKPGKIFKANNGVLFFDEINRCPEKLQNSLLQVLEEKKITLGSFTVDIPVDFIFIATMNPEDTSTEKLSEVMLDRFEVVHMNYPESKSIEKQILKNKASTYADVPEKTVDVIVGIIRQIRSNPDLEKKPSIRATIGLYECASAHARVMGKKVTDNDDIEAVIDSVLAHRIKLKPSLKFLKKPEEIIREEFKTYTESEREMTGDSP